jgi:hypothetical protein
MRPIHIHPRKMSAVNIPITSASKINPYLENPYSHSVIYTFSHDKGILDDDGNIIFKFPYSKNTFWTNFKYSVTTGIGPLNEQLDIGLKFITTDEDAYEIISQTKTLQTVWQDTEWSLPSIEHQDGGGIYFVVKPPKDINLRYEIKITLLGFIGLFPEAGYYVLLTKYDVPEFIFSESDKNYKGITEYNSYIKNYDFSLPQHGIRKINRY